MSYISKYYDKKEEFAKIKLERSKKDDNIASFGSFILKFEISHPLSILLDKIYNKTKELENLDLKEATDIFKLNSFIEVTVIKDKMISDKIKEEIIAHFPK